MRYYGLHATCKAKQVKGVLTALMVALGRLIKGTYRIMARQSYRERVLASTGRDPLRCVHCGREMLTIPISKAGVCSCGFLVLPL